MTPQEMFNKAYIGVMTQGVQSKSNGSCLYRGPNGTKCAVGFLIDDDVAKAWDDNSGIIVDCNLKLLSAEMEDDFRANMDLLIEMQSIHDSDDFEDFSTTFKTRMADLAKEQGLEVPAV